MLFNSLQFAVFLPIVFLLYWFVFQKRYTYQNALLLGVSYYFYACWDWRFLFLLMFSTFLDYFSGLKIAASKDLKVRKTWFILSVGINLGFLGVFKYFNFFADSFKSLLAAFGWEVDVWTLSVILPVGISFYTFHGLSYVIDVYKDRIKPEKNVIDYSVFVSYFPLLVAGPIERATHLLPQIQRSRIFDYEKAVSGLRQILWGLFKKVVIADVCSVYVNKIFEHPELELGGTLVAGAFLFALQIYGDFSGYSDIALGTSRLFGIELLKNFSFPYFSRDIAEFWRRWHISLSTWFRDYLYIPLGGSKNGKWRQIRNTFVIFLVSGFWHGANWTFIVWGTLNAIYILPSVFFSTNRNNLNMVAEGHVLPTLKELLQILFTFSLVVFAWIFFRATSVEQAFVYIERIFTTELFSEVKLWPFEINRYLVFFFAVEWLGREQSFALELLGQRWPKLLRWMLYLFLGYSIFYFAAEEQAFIYFQF